MHVRTRRVGVERHQIIMVVAQHPLRGFAHRLLDRLGIGALRHRKNHGHRGHRRALAPIYGFGPFLCELLDIRFIREHFAVAGFQRDLTLTSNIGEVSTKMVRSLFAARHLHQHLGRFSNDAGQHGTGVCTGHHHLSYILAEPLLVQQALGIFEIGIAKHTRLEDRLQHAPQFVLALAEQHQSATFQ